MPEAEATPPPGVGKGTHDETPGQPRLARTVKELADGRYLLLYNHPAEPPADR